MMEERRLGKLEASLGLALLAGLLAALAGAYVYRFDQPPPPTPHDPNWTSAQPADAAPDLPVGQTSYRPQWLMPHDEPARPKYVR